MAENSESFLENVEVMRDGVWENITRVGKASRANPPFRSFDTGATRDIEGEKLDFEGFEHPSVVRRFAEFMHKNRPPRDGARRDSDNWQRGIPCDVYMKSMWRHFFEVWEAHRAGKTRGAEFEEALCALRFNVNGYLFEILRDAKTQKVRNESCELHMDSDRR